MNLIKIFSTIVICLVLTSCDPAGTISTPPIEFDVHGLGHVTRYEISSGNGGIHFIYVLDNGQKTLNYQQGKQSTTVMMINGIEYIPKNEKN